MSKLCDICPRNCRVDREKNLGVCGATNRAKIAKVMLHYFEEPPISGEWETTKGEAHGSGAIFFSNCSLKCIFCQNEEISHRGLGKEVDTETLVNIFKQLESAGAFNINLVSPTHYTEQIIQALDTYRPKIPVVWNTSGYETVKTIKRLKNYVDIFLVDFKYFDENLASEFSAAKNYPEVCKSAILEMRKNQPKDVFEDGLMKKGMIIRHLVLPNCTDDSIKIFDWINKNLGNKTFVSLMSQYVPFGKAKENKKLNRVIKPVEYKIVLNAVKKMGFENCFVQDLCSASDCFTPNFKQNDGKFIF